MEIAMLLFYLIPVCLIMYGIIAFAKNVGGNDPKNMPLYRWILFYNIGAFAVMFGVVTSVNSTTDIDTYCIPLLLISYILSVVSLFRFRKGPVTLPFVLDLIFGFDILFFMFFLFCEILQRTGFYKSMNIGYEPVLSAFIIQVIFGLMAFRRSPKQ